MMGYKLFTLEEARELLPSLRAMLREANQDLADKQRALQTANEYYERSEEAVDRCDRGGEIEALRAARTRFQEAIYELSSTQKAYLSRLDYWVDTITATGIILRDLQEGLVDFPCCEGELEYLLCWRMDESDINFWHLEGDGFRGRKPLSTLSEYQ